MHKGIIKRIITDGYERIFLIHWLNEEIAPLWCYFLETDEYLENNSESKIVRVNEEISCELSIELVNSYIHVDNLHNESYKQAIDESPHIEVIGTVTELVDECTIFCKINELGNILVDFEEDYKDCKPGNKIKFSGTLKIDLV